MKRKVAILLRGAVSRNRYGEFISDTNCTHGNYVKFESIEKSIRKHIIEFNWFDQDLLPISLVREVHSGKKFSVNHYEMYEFKEFQGRDRTVGNSIDGNYSKEK